MADASPPPSKRVTVVAACNACRQRKAKCTGERPKCAACIKRAAVCEYQTRSTAETHRQAHKRKLTELETTTNTYQALVDRIRNGSDDEAQEIYRQIRSGADLVAVLGDDSTSRDDREPLFAFSSNEASDNDGAVGLLEAMASSTDFDSSMLLARLRTGESWAYLANRLGVTSSSPSHLTPAPSRFSRTGSEGVSGGESKVVTQRLDQFQLGEEEAPVGGRFNLPMKFDREIWMLNRSATTEATVTRPRDLQPHDPIVFSPAMDNLFGNLPFSSSIWANNHPPQAQQAQHRYIFLPVWAIHTMVGPCGVPDPFEAIFADLIKEINNGVDIDAFCGPHVFLDALHDELAFKRAPVLSQVLATIVRSIKSDEHTPSMTQYGAMWMQWTLWRWMLKPSPESYNEMPPIMRPTPSQLFYRHTRVFDFIFSPKLREYMCQVDSVDYGWLTEACITAHCDWPLGLQAGLVRNSHTGETDLSAACKARVAMPESWSLGPSVRPFIRNVDQYITIR